MARWQYPILSEPVFVPAAAPEIITLDKWFAPWPDPVRRVPRRQTAGAIDGTTIWPSQVTPDLGTNYWFSPWPEPRHRPRRQYEYTSAPVFVQAAGAETITLDKWFQPWPDPVRRIPRRQTGGATDGTTIWPAQITTDLGANYWFIPWPDPIRRAARRGGEQIFAPVFVAATAEVITLDKWFQPWPEPTRRSKARQLAGGVFVHFAETVTLDKWYRAWPDPIRRAKPRQMAGIGDHTAVWAATSTVIARVELQWDVIRTAPLSDFAVAAAPLSEFTASTAPLSESTAVTSTLSDFAVKSELLSEFTVKTEPPQ